MIRPALGLCALGLLVAPETARAATQVWKADVVVQSCTERPWFGSGIIHFMAEIDVMTLSGERFPVYRTYFGETDFLPGTGARCRIKFHLDRVRDAVLFTRPPVPRGSLIRVLDNIECGPNPITAEDCEERPAPNGPA